MPSYCAHLVDEHGRHYTYDLGPIEAESEEDAIKIVMGASSSVIDCEHKHKPRRKVGICGQAPSDFPEFAEFLVECGIDSISLNPDSVIKTRLTIAETEKRLGR